jgi:uncharacterized protein (TIGR00369 family)
MENWPKIDLEPFVDQDQDMCFVCGKSNPIGLKMQFNWDEKNRTVSADFIPDEKLQGWAGHVHGGISACIMDEAIGWAAMSAGTNNVTARLQVRYRRMLPINRKFVVSATITKLTSRLIETEAKICDEAGEVYAEATSTQFIVSKREVKK